MRVHTDIQTDSGSRRLAALATTRLQMLLVAICVTFLAGVCPVIAQISSSEPAHSAQSPSSLPMANYILGPDDLLTFLASDLDELNKTTVRISLAGDVSLPLIGQVHASGLTVEELQAKVRQSLSKFVLHPDVVISVAEYHSQPVSVIGPLASPGIFQIQGHKTLEEILSMAGGLDLQAGSTLTITRKLKWGPLPLANAKNDPTGRFSIGTIGIRDLITAANPDDNIQIMPEDIISVAKAEQIFVLGSVIKPGAIGLGQEKSLTALQAVAEAWGLGKASAPTKARLMRLIPGSNGERTETPINLKQLLAGKIPDIQLQANDILFVPSSLPKTIAAQVGQSAVQAGSAIAIVASH